MGLQYAAVGRRCGTHEEGVISGDSPVVGVEKPDARQAVLQDVVFNEKVHQVSNPTQCPNSNCVDHKQTTRKWQSGGGDEGIIEQA